MAATQVIACSNCGAPLDGRVLHGRLSCSFCGSQHNLPEAGAGADADRVLALGVASQHSCPRCGVPLQQGLMDEQRVEHCADCNGVLLPRETFAAVVSHRRARYRGPDAVPRPLDGRELERIVGCPGCGERMEVHPYYGPGPAVIDSCSRCALVWLDRGEMTVIETAPGRRGTARRR
jgi:Zn-finger nucleic acid-binding protein